MLPPKRGSPVLDDENMPMVLSSDQESYVRHCRVNCRKRRKSHLNSKEQIVKFQPIRLNPFFRKPQEKPDPSFSELLHYPRSRSVMSPSRGVGRVVYEVGLGFIWTLCEDTSSKNLQGGKAHLPLAAGHGDIDEAASVLYPLEGAALGLLLLLLGLDLCCTISISIRLFNGPLRHVQLLVSGAAKWRLLFLLFQASCDRGEFGMFRTLGV